jgi:hypothetical protein
MSQCVTLNADGTLTSTGQPVESCAGYVLVDATEHANMSFLATLFQWPETNVVGTWLVGAFAFVVVCNVAGSMVGSVVRMVSSDRQ